VVGFNRALRLGVVLGGLRIALGLGRGGRSRRGVRGALGVGVAHVALGAQALQRLVESRAMRLELGGLGRARARRHRALGGLLKHLLRRRDELGAFSRRVVGVGAPSNARGVARFAPHPVDDELGARVSARVLAVAFLAVARHG